MAKELRLVIDVALCLRACVATRRNSCFTTRVVVAIETTTHDLIVLASAAFVVLSSRSSLAYT